MKASEIVSLLAARHAGDVFVSECKDGPTQSGTHLRLDAWAMPRSWAKPWCSGYEVKVSRADFLKDEKWHGYLALCNSFYFVSPRGLIAPEELPSEAGLIWVSKTGTKLFTKRKAPLRQDVEIPETLFRYVLMCRAKIERENWNDGPKREQWEAWLREKLEGADLGWRITGRVREIVNRVQSENRLLRAKNESLEGIRDRIRELGFSPDNGVSSWEVHNALNDLIGERAPTLMHDMKRLLQSMGRLHRDLGRRI